MPDRGKERSVKTGSSSRNTHVGPDKRRRQLEKNVSAKQCFKEENTRIQNPHENEGRTTDSEKKTGQRKKAFDGLTNTPDLRFPRNVRVRSRTDYLKVQRSGRKIRGRYFILLTSFNDLPITRFGITVSKRYGNAVKRNSIKRKVREIQRLNRRYILSGNDIVIIVRQKALEATFRQMEEEYLQLAHQAGLVEEG